MEFAEIFTNIGQASLFILALIVIAAGYVVTFANLPGAWLILLGIFLSWVASGFDSFHWSFFIIFIIIALISSVIDNIAMLFGAKLFGASKWGIIGAIIGAIVGLLIGSIWGFLIGPFVGAVLLEIIAERKEILQAGKAGIGTIVGLVASIFLRVILCTLMIGIWALLLIF